MTNKHLLLFAVAVMLAACGGKEPKVVHTSYPTMSITKSNVKVPLKFSVSPKVSK